MKEPRHYDNVSRHETCEVCFDEGWVTLKGYYQIYGYHYSNGSAPCKWCEIGNLTTARAHTEKVPITDNYRIENVDGYDPDAEYYSKAEAKRMIKELIAGFHRQNLDEMDPETRRLVELQLAARARNYAPPPKEAA